VVYGKTNPSRKWLEILEAVKKNRVPSDPFMKRVYRVLKGELEDTIIQYVKEKIEVDLDKHILATFILSGATHKEIASYLWIEPVEAVDIFASLYMDVSVFKDKMEHYRFCKTYVTEAKDPYIEDLMQVALYQGPKAMGILWRRGYESINVSPEDLINSVTTMAYDKIIQARTQNVASTVSDESRKWVKSALDAIEARGGLDSGHNEALEAVLKINRDIKTKYPEDLGIDLGDILH
jgi:hypothetical protein